MSWGIAVQQMASCISAEKAQKAQQEALAATLAAYRCHPLFVTDGETVWKARNILVKGGESVRWEQPKAPRPGRCVSCGSSEFVEHRGQTVCAYCRGAS